MKTTTLFTLAAVASAYCWGALGLTLQGEPSFHPADVWEYHMDNVTSFDEEYQVSERLGNWVNREWRDLRTTASRNITELQQVARDAREAAYGEKEAGTSTQDAVNAALAQALSSAPVTSLRPQPRPADLMTR